MQPILLTTFTELLILVAVVFFWMLAISVFISVFADIFRRRDMSGFAKAMWIILIFIIPFLGALIYIIARPPLATFEQDMEIIEAQRRAAGTSAADEIAKAQQLLQSGAISQAEFDKIKARVVG